MKRNIVVIVLILSILVLLTGCAASVPNPTPQPPASATLTVYSSCFICWGYVWVNGASTGKYIDFNGAVTITGLTPGPASVEIRGQDGAVSHTEYVNLVPGNNVVNFTYWW
jgi:hypothetical protein